MRSKLLQNKNIFFSLINNNNTMTRRNPQVLLKKRGNRYQHVLVTGNGVISLDRNQNSNLGSGGSSNNIEAIAHQALIEPAVEKAPKTKADILSEIDKRFSSFTKGDNSAIGRNKHFRLK